MGLELRTVRDEEMGDFLRAVQHRVRRCVAGRGRRVPGAPAPGRALPGGRTTTTAVVATAGAFPFRLTVPGGAQVGVAAVTVVTVQPTHRRQGLLRQMMDEQLDDVARRGEPLAALTASEASIYERFGYGIATFTTRWELASEYADTRRVPLTVRCASSRETRRARRPARCTTPRPRRAPARSSVRRTGGRRSSTAGNVACGSSPRCTTGRDGRPDAFARYAARRRPGPTASRT